MNFNYCPKCGTKGSIKKLDETNYECVQCAWHFWNNAKAAVSIALVKDGRVLVCRSGVEPVKGRAGLPGGFVDYGEDAYDAAVREIFEETDLHIDKHDLTLVATYPYTYMPGVTTCDLIFVASKWQGTISPKDDVAALEWKPFDFLETPNFHWPYHGLADILSQRFTKGKKSFEQ